MVVVAISGLSGAGKTTTAQAVIRKFKRLRYVSAGEVFRQLAKERGMTLDEFSRYAENHPAIDRMIDRRTADAARLGRVLIDARLAGWMAKKADLKVLLTAPFKVRVMRIARREGRGYRSVYEETLRRERSEVKRFKKFYNIDVNDFSPFDIVINTDRLSCRETAKLIEFAINMVMSRRK